MSIVKFNPARIMLRDMMGPRHFTTLFDSLMNDEMFSKPDVSSFRPRTDIVEKEDRFEIHLSLPGLKKEDIKIDLKDGHLTVSGERKFHKEEKEARYHLSENVYGSFSRSFAMPDNVKQEDIDARFEDGMLSITLIKKEVAAPTTISIK